MMLALPAPARRPYDNAISLRVLDQAAIKMPDLRQILTAYGCPTAVSKRAISSLFQSGRYDCRVSRAIGLRRAREVFGRIGIDLLAFRDDGSPWQI